MERRNEQALPQGNYATPQLRLYGSVAGLTAGGTGMLFETGMFINCNDGMTPGNDPTKKHCV